MKQAADLAKPAAIPREVPGTASRGNDSWGTDSRPERLNLLASRLSRMLGLARALAQNGRALDLTGVDDGIGMLCAQTLDLDRPEARQMLPLLHEVLGQVNSLEAAMRGNPDSEPAPAPAGVAARAAKAYRQ